MGWSSKFPPSFTAKDVLPQDLHREVRGRPGMAVSLAQCPAGRLEERVGVITLPFQDMGFHLIVDEAKNIPKP